MKIIVATGGSGGHIFPALNVADVLKSEGHEISVVGVFGSYREQIEKRGYPVWELKAKGLSTDSAKSILQSSVCMIESIIQSLGIIKEIKPSAVIGFGGYGAFPVVMAAVMARCPTMIHEQNVYPGRANAILGRLVRKVALSFEASHDFFHRRNTIFTGYPTRTWAQYDKQKIALELGLRADSWTILVMGGSQGSHRLNEEFLGAAGGLQDTLDFQVIHLSGTKDQAWLEKSYAQMNIRHRVFAFFEQMDKIYALADLVIGRAGAGTVSEIVLFKISAILIPYPLAGGHQKSNAQILAQTPAAKMIEEKELTTDKLKEAILLFAQKRPTKEQLGKWLEGMSNPQAAQLIARELISLVS